MHDGETEWQLQKRLTAGWLGDVPVILHGEPLFLAAWEVMTSYKVDDARRHWNAPSIDFVFLDRAGSMVLVELKREVRTPRAGWGLLCQVSHRAHALAAGFSRTRLEAVYLDCRSGLDRRIERQAPVKPLLEAHADAFSQPALGDLPALPVRRMVMADAFAPSFSHVLDAMNSGTPTEVASALGRYKPTGEIKRYLEIRQDPTLVDAAPIRAVTTDGRTWPGRPPARQ
jgi:hypothetical protein